MNTSFDITSNASIETNEDVFNYMKNMLTLNPSNAIKICDSCSGINVIIDTYKGNMICIDCGTEKMNAIIINGTDQNPNDGSNDITSNRVSEFHNPLLTSGVQTTKIKGSPSKQKMHQWNNGYTYTDFVFLSVCSKMKKIRQKCKNPVITEACTDHAQSLYKRYMTDVKKIKRCKMRDGIIAGCLYWGCKRNKLIISIETLAELYKVENKHVSYGISTIHQTMYPNELLVEEYMFTNTNVSYYVEIYCKQFNLVKSDICIKIANIIDENIDIFNNTPATLAGAIIYHIVMHYSLMKGNEIKKLIDTHCKSKAITTINCNNNALTNNKKLFKHLLI